MATRIGLFCRQCISLSSRTNTSGSLLKQHNNNRNPLYSNVRCMAAVCRKECCRLSPPSCWKCRWRLSGHADFFCPKCAVIQPPEDEATYFEIMDRPEVFRINTSKLSKDYRELQMKLHPDRFSLSTEEEQHFSALQSSAVNKAYQTLLRPLKRGLYLLKLQGLSLEEGDTTPQDPEFLMKILEINEKLEDATTLDDITIIENENKVDIERCIKEVAESFDRDDYASAKEGLIQLKYYSNISNQMKDRKISLGLAGEH